MADELSDSYVAELLKNDAKTKSKEYSLVGMSAFLPKRSRTDAPKPNLRFLQNILRETDSHNAALKEKEESDSREKLRALRRNGGKTTRREERRHDKKEEDRPTKRRRVDHDYPEGERDRKPQRRHEKEGSERKRRDGSHLAYDRARSHPPPQGEDDDSRRHRRPAKHHRSKRSRERSDSEDNRGRRSHGHRRHRRDRSRSRSWSPASHVRERQDKHGTGRKRAPSSKKMNESIEKKFANRHQDSDSDPLEAIVGPLQAPASPQPHLRGRGAHSSSSAMDARFSASYNPTDEAQPDSDNDDDDWGLALERFRDREKWKALGAQRLKSAGFSDVEIKKWEKSGQEKDESDVTWSKKGEGREWDRGKVVDGTTGEVDVRAEWGRLS